MITDESKLPFSFEGTSEELSLAMEKAFVLNKRVINKTINATKKLKLDNPELRIKKVRKQGGFKKVVEVRPFNRNHDGATKDELDRASHLVTNILKVSPEVTKSYSTNLKALTDEFTSFLVLQIAPYESAVEAALDDASETVRLMTGVEHASFDLGRAEGLIKRLTELKTLDWACDKLQISPDIRTLVLNEYFGSSNKRDNPADSLMRQLVNSSRKIQDEARGSARRQSAQLKTK